MINNWYSKCKKTGFVLAQNGHYFLSARNLHDASVAPIPRINSAPMHITMTS